MYGRDIKGWHSPGNILRSAVGPHKTKLSAECRPLLNVDDKDQLLKVLRGYMDVRDLEVQYEQFKRSQAT